MEPGPQCSYRDGHIDGGGSGRCAHHGSKRWAADGATGRSSARTSRAGSEGERGEMETEEELEVKEVDLNEPETPGQRGQEVRRKHGFLSPRSPCSCSLVGPGPSRRAQTGHCGG
jgi:hypothetical protein